ncbi:WD40 repeat-like protein [Saccharata proteae CBS 121410]|uniref:WD40 repeat-like protein n=1 Tax=Saccharata proteae CBS 121410 TaxID=1314787 RepID=A0A9P4LX70_9PEZI|nr:WD40 repeat-like protein [Saccharata proteae CBS 121410]
MALQQRLRGLPAHPPGPTFLSYTPNGRKLITVGLNNAIRIFTTGSTDEPINIDGAPESNTAVAAANDFFVIGSEDGTVSRYSLETNSLLDILIRCSLPVRDIALSPDKQWVAVASDEIAVKIVNTEDMSQVLRVEEHRRAPKHVSFDVSGSYLAVSCSDGKVYVYSLSSETPQLVKTVDGLIPTLETDVEASSKVLWHPDGRALAAPTATRDVQVMSTSDWERQKAFKDSHRGDITSGAWLPNGGLLATAGHDRKLVIWDTKTQKVIKMYEDLRATVLAMAWHPTENILSYTNNDGELFIHTDIIPQEHISILEKDLQPAPFFHDPLAETTGNAGRPLATGNGTKEGIPIRRQRRGTPDSLDDILGDEGLSDHDDFIEDDDGAGYTEGVLGKRPANHLGDVDYRSAKRTRGGPSFQPELHPSFQPGSTPWRGNRRYLCLNLTGFVWTVDQETHHTVTVEFYDRSTHRDFHFTDPFLYDKACLNENGTLLSCPPSPHHPATIYYRPHETWTTRTDWRTQLPAGETVTSISLSDSFIVVTTSADYVRIYTLFGVPYRLYRQKSTPAVTCASWRDYILTIGNGPVGPNGTTRLLYTLENVKRDEICQSEDIVALSPNATLQSVFFSDQGDPCIYDSTGVLLVLQHWRQPGQARWVPLLDTKSLARLASGRKAESYWPVAVARDRFHCIILKGQDKHPYFPRPLLTDFEFQIPVHASLGKPAGSNDDEDEDMNAQDSAAVSEPQKLEELYVRNTLLLSLLEDLTTATRATHTQRTELARRELEVDKTLLQLLAVECREGEERGMKALEIVTLMRDSNGKLMDAAAKIADRFQRDVLRGKIEEVAERRQAGFDGIEYD